MSALDWAILAGSLVFIVVYGVWKGRGSRNIRGFLLSDRDMRWYTITLSVMATQASAITFLSTPGQAFADGLRFVQFYFGLPLAMVILSLTAVPIFHRLGVYTAYEYLETRFDLKTRALAALLFLIQRGLAAGLTLFAPALVLSVLLGWNLSLTCAGIGLLVIIYTTSGGTRAVSWVQSYQVLIIAGGMLAAVAALLYQLPEGVSLSSAGHLAGTLGRLNAVDLTFDPRNRYNLWSGLIGGLFLQLAYFGTDQSQVQRYLTGRSVRESRLGLLMNGLLKVPMQFGILLLGVLVFVFYQFTPPPVFFNPLALRQARSGPYAHEFNLAEQGYQRSWDEKNRQERMLLPRLSSGDAAVKAAARQALRDLERQVEEHRAVAVTLIRRTDPAVNPSDTNYVFLSFVLHFLPAGLIGLVLAAVFAASMSSTSAELNALASTTVVDVYRRLLGKGGGDRRELLVSRLATVGWGVFAVAFAEYASRLGTLVEAVNILGSLFYGTILGIFTVAFFLKKIRGGAVFAAAIAAEAAVVACFLFTPISFLWYNVVGCVLVMLLAWIFQSLRGSQPAPGI